MQSLGCVDIDEYINTINGNPEEKTECKRLLTVPITRFYRDRKLWEVLEYDLLPAMVLGREDPFRVWSAGCSGGEEAYTFAIIWHCLAGAGRMMPDLEILATDMNPECLSRAKRGLYSVSSLKEVSDDIRQRFFIKTKKQFQVVKDLRTMVRWEQRNLFDTPSEVGFDIIFLRNNLLTYYQEPDKSEGFNRVVSSLKKGGVLVIGSHEPLPEAGSGFIRNKAHPLVLMLS